MDGTLPVALPHPASLTRPSCPCPCPYPYAWSWSCSWSHPYSSSLSGEERLRARRTRQPATTAAAAATATTIATVATLYGPVAQGQKMPSHPSVRGAHLSQQASGLCVPFQEGNFPQVIFPPWVGSRSANIGDTSLGVEGRGGEGWKGNADHESMKD